MGDARVDEARLFHTRDDFDGMTERFAGALQERLLAVRESQGIRPDDTHAVSVHIAQTLPETLQAGERSRGDFLVDPAVLFDPAARRTISRSRSMTTS